MSIMHWVAFGAVVAGVIVVFALVTGKEVKGTSREGDDGSDISEKSPALDKKKIDVYRVTHIP